jgi:PAS domain S-box-containing protein
VKKGAVRLIWCAFFLLVIGSAVYFFSIRPGSPPRSYRIGWQYAPPYQVASSGQPTGLAVELVREAARRRGIELTWIRWQDSSESALREKAVDMWPLITITPERLKSFHITEPYMEAEHTLLVREDGPYKNAEDLGGAVIGLANASIDVLLLRRLLPNARSLPLGAHSAVIESVCDASVDAGFMDAYTAIAALLTQPPCGGHPLRWIPVPDSQTKLGIGATFEASAAADDIRKEIGAMAREGRVAPILGKWGFTPAQNLVSLGALVDARRRVARLAVATTIFAFLFGLACWQTIVMRRARSRARQTEKALRDADQKLVLLANNLKEMVLAFDMDRKLVYVNPAVETLTGYSVAEYTAHGFIDWVHPEDRSAMLSQWDGLFQEGNSYQDQEYRLITKSGAVKWVSATWGPILDEHGQQVGVQGSERDVSDRKCAEEALREAEQRNMQSQKMESIGRLAGGVAHDFNNLLTVINGYAELLLLKAGAESPERAPLEQILQAGTRAADLTRQLLAYSRKQVMNPQPLDLNTLVAGSQHMFQRLLGEEIQLIVKPQPALGLVMAEAGQMHQVLMNLLVNARDAMPGGGKVFVETSNVEIGAEYLADHPYATAGHAVLLQVTDGGVGIDDETKKNIFEPFFTTKGIGVGTGLGLATVYGIVKQSHGWIVLYSELGKGTSFKIYLPRIDGGSAQLTAGIESSKEALGGQETVMIVEDQEEVRNFASQVLEGFGYRVLAAKDGPDAVAVATHHSAPIHILLTDVVMPGMNGRQLADQLTAQRPDMKVLFTSGYTQEVIAHHGVLDADVDYLSKPYSPETLATRLREVLDRNGTH